jgi:hypothetical protein
MPKTIIERKANQTFIVRLNREDIKLAVALIKGITKFTHTYLASSIDDDFKRAYNLTKMTTMVATGETKGKLFKRHRKNANSDRFRYGYRPTSNNQSVHQEFDDGPVHKSHDAHFHELGGAKCSRAPNDLYSSSGRYLHNTKARRRAMAKSIETVFSTNVRSAVIRGGNYFYRPSFARYAFKKSTHLAKVYKAVGITV